MIQPERGLPASIFQPCTQHACQLKLQVLDDGMLLSSPLQNNACIMCVYILSNFNNNQALGEQTVSPSFSVANASGLFREYQRLRCPELFRQTYSSPLVCQLECSLFCTATPVQCTEVLNRYDNDVGGDTIRCRALPKLSFNGPFCYFL